jgi:Replication-relaxation
MPTTSSRRIVRSRDIELLTALDRSPLTAVQLLKLSQTFTQPFQSERTLRERLQHLCEGGFLRFAFYATSASGASPKYYRLGRTGYAVLYGENAAAPTKRYFAALSIGRQHHTHCLAEFLVHTLVAAHRTSLTFTSFYRENTLRLQVGSECLYPDASFQLVASGGQELNYFVELDNHTERIRSQQDADSWQRKLRLYNELQSLSAARFRVLIVSTRSGERLKNILTLAEETASEVNRSLCYGVHLPGYLSCSDALHSACFLDHRRRPTSLVPLRWQDQQSGSAAT